MTDTRLRIQNESHSTICLDQTSRVSGVYCLVNYQSYDIVIFFLVNVMLAMNKIKVTSYIVFQTMIPVRSAKQGNCKFMVGTLVTSKSLFMAC